MDVLVIITGMKSVTSLTLYKINSWYFAIFLTGSTSGPSFASSSFKKGTPKRALFPSPDKNSPSKRGSIFGKKRKRSESEDFQPLKFSRSLSMDIHPSGSELHKPLVQRSQSDCFSVSSRGAELSDHHKKVRILIMRAAN